jgi:hypothetical protein
MSKDGDQLRRAIQALGRLEQRLYAKHSYETKTARDAIYKATNLLLGAAHLLDDDNIYNTPAGCRSCGADLSCEGHARTCENYEGE